MSLRLRVLKRHTSLEVPFDEFFMAEMRDHDGKPDLNLSVFDIDVDCLVRTHAEYVVTFLQPAPNKKRGGLSLNDCHADFDETQDPAGSIIFEYARDRHVELRFLRESELRVLAEKIHTEHVERERSAAHGDVVAYGQSKLDEADEEWIRACATRPKWKKAFGR
jgi:hypothetical protein